MATGGRSVKIRDPHRSGAPLRRPAPAPRPGAQTGAQTGPRRLRLLPAGWGAGAAEETTAMSRTIEAPYGSWVSPITADLIVGQSIALSDVLVDGKEVYWIEGRPAEAGRAVLVAALPGGATLDVVPAPYNCRSRVHEYGGGAVTVDARTVIFANFADQRLYRIGPGETMPRPLTPEGAMRYADGVVDRRRGLWIGVREDHGDPAREAVNSIVAIDLAAGGPGRVLVEGSDFYSFPRLSPDCTRLAWTSWNHPDMPWVGSELWTARLGPDGGLSDAALVAGGRGESIFQPAWSPDGRLHFVSDRTGWWNLYRLEADGSVAALCPRAAELGRAQWSFGLSTYDFVGDGRILCAHLERGGGRLGLLDPGSRTLTELDLPYTELGWVRVAGGRRAVFRAGSPTEPAAIVALDLATGAATRLKASTGVADDPAFRDYVSVPVLQEFPTAGGRTAFGFYYPPANRDYRAPAGEAPPLLVKCHGGPTAATSSVLNLANQFWTSRGIAVLDVDYGGSTGYGRAYRDRLQGAWGVVDVDDCVNGAAAMARQGLADAARMVITGGSAGGYTTLAALAFRDVFKGGASYYGVSDAAALARDTHKFESRYLDWLIGPWPEQAALYRERSPIHHVDRLKVPVAFFQGAEDRVVPPNQTEMMVEALRRKGIPAGYILFEGEQHGFRRGANIKRALEAELYFYALLVFGIRLGY
jgi:dipeptidyl aminopeptidase/acylaminoacyl peptidase